MTDKHENITVSRGQQDPSGYGAGAQSPSPTDHQETAGHGAAEHDQHPGQQEFYVYRGSGGKEYKLPIGFKDEMNKRIAIERDKANKERQTEFDKYSQSMVLEHERLKSELAEQKKASENNKQQKDIVDEEHKKRMAEINLEAEEFRNKYHDVLISKAIYDNLSRFDLWNRSQVEIIIKDIAKAEVDEKGNVSFNYQGEKINTFELCKIILSMPENDNLIKSDGRNIEKQKTERGSSSGSFLRKDYNLRLKVSDVM